jgi:hypothetical protein
MRTLDPRLVLYPAGAVVALLWSITNALATLATANPWPVLLAAPAPLLLGIIRRWVAIRLLLALLAAGLLLAITLPGPVTAVIAVAIALLTTAATIEHSSRTPLAPDAVAAAFAVATALWLGMQGVTLALEQARVDYADVWLPLLLALVLVPLAASPGPAASLGERNFSAGGLLVVLALIPAWTFVPRLLATSAISASVVVSLLLGCAVLAMALLPLIGPQRFALGWLTGAVVAAIGVQFADAALPASALGVLVTPFLVRYTTLGLVPAQIRAPQIQPEGTPSARKSGVLPSLAAFVGLALLVMGSAGIWPAAVNPGAVTGVAVLLVGVKRGDHAAEYLPARPSALHWPGAGAGMIAVVLLGWYLAG